MLLLRVHEGVERVRRALLDLVQLHLRELDAELAHLEQRRLEGRVEDE